MDAHETADRIVDRIVSDTVTGPEILALLELLRKVDEIAEREMVSQRDVKTLKQIQKIVGMT